MEITLSIYEVAFWATVYFTAIGGFLALMGIWIDEFWESETACKLLLTDAVLAGTSLLVALLTKWLA